MVALINCCTSVYAGFAIFSMIGFLAAKTGVPVQDAATSGLFIISQFILMYEQEVWQAMWTIHWYFVKHAT